MKGETEMSTEVAEFEVVIVGAGPGGLAGAVTLGGYGIETLVLERRLSHSTLPRANAASTRTMELLRRWNLEGAARERSLDVEFQALAISSLAAAEGGEAIDVGFPTRHQASLISPAAPAAIGQDELEPLLEDRARSFPSVRLKRGVELLSLERETDGGYLLTLGDRGGARRVRTRYLIGADGMRSTVREELGIATDDSGSIGERLAIHFRAPVWEKLGDQRYVIYFVTAGPEDRAFVPIGRPDRWVFAMQWDDTRPPVETLTAEQLTRWVRDAAGDPDLPIAIDRTMRTSYAIGLAERFRDGDAFLIGDAAHRVTPRGATGLNTAIRDGFDLGWKLGWVLRGWADDGLLETYERERRPVAEFNAERSGKSDGSIIGNGLGLSVDLGGRIPHAWAERSGALVSTLDLLGEGLTRFAGPDWDGTTPCDAGGPPVAVERLDWIAARALGLTSAGSLLVRPDGQPVALSQATTNSPVPSA
jgi:putative polyketide hydroxylase